MPKPRSRSRLWSLAPLAVLVFAGWQAATTVARTPALNPSLLVETSDGDKFPRFLPAMYSYPEYLYEVAYDWRQRPGVVPTFGGGDSAGGTGMLSRLRRMRDLLAEGFRTGGVNPETQANALNSRNTVTESLRLQPGNPAAWILLARMNDTLGDQRAAFEAYLSSQILAPRTSVYAAMRLGFLEDVLETPEGEDIARSMIDPEIVRTDMQAAEMRGYKRLVESPVLVGFLGDQSDTN